MQPAFWVSYKWYYFHGNFFMQLSSWLVHFHLPPQTLPLEVSVLQVFYVYAQQCPGSQLGECWVPLLSMVKEGTLTLSPPAQLVLLAILNEFVQRAPPLQEKKDVKELQVGITPLYQLIISYIGFCHNHQTRCPCHTTTTSTVYCISLIHIHSYVGFIVFSEQKMWTKLLSTSKCNPLLM